MRDLWQKCDKFLIEFSQGIKIIFIQGDKIKMGIFTKFKLTEVLSTFCYLVEIISINKLQNLKIINKIFFPLLIVIIFSGCVTKVISSDCIYRSYRTVMPELYRTLLQWDFLECNYNILCPVELIFFKFLI